MATKDYKICSKAFFSYTNDLQLPNKCFQFLIADQAAHLCRCFD